MARTAQRGPMTTIPAGTTTNDPLDLSLSQFSEAWRLMCRSGPAARISADEGIEYVFSGCPIPFFNVALLTERSLDAEKLRRHAQQACAWAAEQGVPWFFVLTHETLAPGVDAGAILDGAGLSSVMPLTGMVATHVATADPPSGLELVVPQDDALCEAAIDVNSAAYAMDLEPAKALIGRHAFWADQFLVVGRAEGKPVCSAAVMLLDGYRYVALVATAPDYQRRGFGDAAMRRSLELSAAAHGDITTVLHATDAGRPVYTRMGYTPISTHTLFMEKRFTEGH